MERATLIGYVPEHTEARRVFGELSKKGFRRLVLLSKAADGKTERTHPSVFQHRYSFILAALVSVALGGFAMLVAFILGSDWLEGMPGLPLYICVGTFASLAAWICLQRFVHGVGTVIVQEQIRLLMPGESALILQTPVGALEVPVAYLRAISDIPTTLFILYPKLERRIAVRGLGVRFSKAQIAEYATRYAGEQEIDSTSRNGAEMLKRLKESIGWVKHACNDLAVASRLEQKVTPAADWILDNEYILEGNVRVVLRNLSRRFYQQLPALSAGPHKGMPYIYCLAKDLISHTELRLERDNILAFIEAYQSARTLTIRELWAVAQMLRIALIESVQDLIISVHENLREGQLADFWANRIIAADRHSSSQFFAVLTELSTAEPLPSAYFCIQLASLLIDEPTVLAPVQDWFERVHGKSLHDLNLSERKWQTFREMSYGNVFSSLRQLELLDWREIFEKLCRVEQILSREPSGIYKTMDFATRDRCRRVIEELAHTSVQTEEELARFVQDLAAQAGREGDYANLERHVSTWLIGPKRSELAELLCCRETLHHRVLDLVYRHHTSVYFLTVGAVSLALSGLLAGFGLPKGLVTSGAWGVGLGLGFVLVALFPVSQLAIEVVNYLVTRFVPPRSLPKMDFSSTGIPDEFRTLVVVPVMLIDAETIDNEAEKLEIRYLANRENNLIFGMFSDYSDSDSPSSPDDDYLLERAMKAIEELNRRHGSKRFFLFHRERVWSDSEQKYIGWERKRGKLEELNSLIDGTRSQSAAPLVYVGDSLQLADIRFVITLDSDTQLPHPTARRLVETLAHPLNQPRFDLAGIIKRGSYTIIQPRVSPTLQSASGSVFSRLFSDPVGIDPYTSAISDVYQDLSGEGTYHGKGIYDVRAFSRILSARFPQERILSHDLIEGAYTRVGLANDIELYDDFPQRYEEYGNRIHRWIRGDWQIARWLFPRVPLADGGSGENPLSILNRLKIFDNLRRSLVPAATLGLLTTSWFLAPVTGVLVTILVGLLLLFHTVSKPLTMATSGGGIKYLSSAKLVHDVERACADAALLPSQAVVSLDAVVRACYRLMFSKRLLLEWKIQSTGGSIPVWKSLFPVSLAMGGFLSIALGVAVWQLQPLLIMLAAPWLVLWLAAPALGWLLNKPAVPQKKQRLPREDRRYLRHVARRTWRYFSLFVNDSTAWLPPDNYQIAHQGRLAMRTSPTNIGLWMTSTLGAHDSGYLTIDQVVDSLFKTMATLSRLERYRGHLLNWYDIESLVPLEPRYVSMVDSGNMLGCLWALQCGLEEIVDAPLLDKKALAGMVDTLEIAAEPPTSDGAGNTFHPVPEEILEGLTGPPGEILYLIRLQQALEEHVATVAENSDNGPWVHELREQMSAWTQNRRRYLDWVEILAEKSEADLAPLGSEAWAAIKHDLKQPPSLAVLACDQVGSIALLKTIRQTAPETCFSLTGWLDRLIEAYDTSQWLAGETLSKSKRLLASVMTLSAEMDMGFMYDSRRKLFAIGYNVSTNRLDGSRYDLLASEARLGSFVAIARGDIPMEHWFALGRVYGSVAGKRVLLSWTGTMFEYLMPLLFQRSYPQSLLDKAAREAVAVQIGFGREYGVPWGISESAYGDLDLHKTYQYKAFGVSALGLKRGFEEKVVVAPYATLLALNVVPRAAMENLRKMTAIGMLGDLGYYESIDFSRQAEREGQRGIVVEAYMAHHQGMSFLALTNFLHEEPFLRRFHNDSRVRAFEALLQERIPALPPLNLKQDRHRESTHLGDDLLAPAGGIFSTPHSATPKSLLLSNGRYGLMITNSGGGYSQWGNLELTRWRADQTCDAMGLFCYVHEIDRDRLWSVPYQPVGGTLSDYSAEFTLDRAVFHRADDNIDTEMEVLVSQEDDIEFRHITLVNRTSHTRTFDLTSYVELSMAPHNGDRQHPAFNKLFIQTEAIAEQQVLLASRRPRSKHDSNLFVAHCLLEKRDGDGVLPEIDWQFETDRKRFIGRGRTLANPMGARQNLGSSQGFVLDPALCVRRRLTLAPGQRAQTTLMLAAGETRADVLRVVDKYRDPNEIERAMDFSWRSAQQKLQVLRIQPDEARRFQQVASHLLFPSRFLRAPDRLIQENRKGQSGLWPYGISGDLPLVLITIGEARDLTLVRQMLQAHTYWRMQGLSADLLIVNEEAAGYELPLQERLQQMIQAYSLPEAAERAGSVYLQHSAQLPESDLNLLNSSASVVLLAARGTLPQQLSRTVEVAEPPEPLPVKPAPREPSAALPFLELHYFNSLGGFTKDGREYAIYLGPHINTPAPWVNVIANPTFGTLVSETGSGFTWYGNSQRNRLTGWSNDPVMDPASEAIYIRDEESGVFWSPTASPIREESAYRARHGAGYSVFEHNSNGIEQELTVFVPVDDNGGVPLKLQRLQLTNGSSRRRRLSLTYFVELNLGENREMSQMHVITQWDAEAQSIVARNHYHPDYPERVTFVSVSPEAGSYGCDRTAFIGRNRTLGNPSAMESVHLSKRTGAGLDPCAALRVIMEIGPNEQRTFTCMLGQADSVSEVRALVKRFRGDASYAAAFEQTVSWWDELLGAVKVRTPELSVDLLVNRWLQYQSLSCRLWGRSGFYQSGGAFGFRDQLQDVLAFLYVRPELAREQILLSASRQFRQGDVQHWWHEPSGAGVRTRISDDLLWLPYVVAQYVRTTGDVDILGERVPFLEAPELADDQDELFLVPEIATEQATLFEHCQRAVGRGLTESQLHGLPKIGTGDWNDGMNLVGAEGKGESVWLAWFLCDLLEGMAELANHLHMKETGQDYLQKRADLIQRIEKSAWDGRWYLRGTFDDGTPLGSTASSEAQIDSLPQSWAWLSGSADELRADQAIESAWKHLVCLDDGVALLFAPPFDKSDPSPGYIAGYPPGVRENGGQYTHAAIWLAMAMARKGDGERAVELLRLLNPIEHARDAEAVWRYGVEPYVVAADVYHLPGKIGQGGWSWYTGSASWMYRAWIEEVFGLQVRNGVMQINPVIPAEWKELTIDFRYSEAVYQIKIENPNGCGHGVAGIELDNRKMVDRAIPLERGPIQHRVVVRMGKPARMTQDFGDQATGGEQLQAKKKNSHMARTYFNMEKPDK